jgi:hypothetical protein
VLRKLQALSLPNGPEACATPGAFKFSRLQVTIWEKARQDVVGATG